MGRGVMATTYSNSIDSIFLLSSGKSQSETLQRKCGSEKSETLQRKCGSGKEESETLRQYHVAPLSLRPLLPSCAGAGPRALLHFNGDRGGVTREGGVVPSQVISLGGGCSVLGIWPLLGSRTPLRGLRRKPGAFRGAPGGGAT